MNKLKKIIKKLESKKKLNKSEIGLCLLALAIKKGVRRG